MRDARSAAASAAAKNRYDADIYPLLTTAWGGEMIHVGLFDDEEEPLRAGLMRTNRRMAEAVGLDSRMEVAEVACGVAGVARELARTYGCRVRASNIAESQLQRARDLTAEEGLQNRIVIEYGDFHDLPYDDERFDCWWSQDSLYHGGDRVRVLSEARRVLKPGGRMALSDFVLDSATPPDDRRHIEEIVGGPEMWSYERCRMALEAVGFHILESFHGFLPVRNTFRRVRERFAALRDDPMATAAGEEAYEATLYRLGLWIERADAHQVGWGYWVAENR